MTEVTKAKVGFVSPLLALISTRPGNKGLLKCKRSSSPKEAFKKGIQWASLKAPVVKMVIKTFTLMLLSQGESINTRPTAHIQTRLHSSSCSSPELHISSAFSRKLYIRS